MTISLIIVGLLLIDIAALFYLYTGDRLIPNQRTSTHEPDGFRYPEAEDMYLPIRASNTERAEAEKRAEENKSLNKMLGRENLKTIYYWRSNVKKFAPFLLLIHFLLFAAYHINFEKAKNSRSREMAPVIERKQ